MYWWLFLLCPLAYLIGGFNVSKTVTKLRHVDLSKVGSGNAGATNVGRAMGFKWFLLVTILECLKCASISAIGYVFVSLYSGSFTFYLPCFLVKTISWFMLSAPSKRLHRPRMVVVLKLKWMG